MSDAAPSFIVIGENIHASRVVRCDGNRIAGMAEGQPCVRVPLDGGEALLPVPSAMQETRENPQTKEPYQWAGFLLVGAPENGGIATRQIAGGASYLDLNVDEASPDVEGRLAAMAWLVRTVGPMTTVPLSLDSSDSAVISP